MKTTNGLLILIGLINCASKSIEFNTNVCTEKYVSNKWKTTVYHSKNWSPYEFYGNNIGLEFKGLQNLERRYDAEIVITFFKDSLKEDEFYSLFIDSLPKRKKEIAKSLGAEFKSKAQDKGQVEFANKKWRSSETEESGSFKSEVFNSREINYLWYSTDTKIRITVRVQGKKIDELSNETDCILKGLVFG